MDTQSLLNRAQSLAGKTFLELAQLSGLTAPTDNRLNMKGWLGQTLERFLGATAGSQSLPDFVELGIELKTIPLLPDGRPKESTYICTAPTKVATLSLGYADGYLRCFANKGALHARGITRATV